MQDRSLLTPFANQLPGDPQAFNRCVKLLKIQSRLLKRCRQALTQLQPGVIHFRWHCSSLLRALAAHTVPMAIPRSSGLVCLVVRLPIATEVNH